MVSIISAIRIIYEFLLANNVKSVTGITGNLYWLNRPKDSKLEDIVVNAVSMNAEALQEGVFNVNVHVPNIELANDNTQPDFIRIEQISGVMVPLLSSVYGFNYNFKIDEPGKPLRDADGTWFCNIRIIFWAVRSTT